MNTTGPSLAEQQSTFSTVSRVSPTQQVQNQLFTAIESGQYAPGSKLPSERVLCETFGVSRVSVREALAGLAATGLIEVRHGKGAFVRPQVLDEYAGPFGRYIATHRHELAELLFVRGALDGIAASSASTQLSDESRAALEQAHVAFAEAVEVGASPVELSDLDVAFHQEIANAAQGTLLAKLLSELNSLLSESRHILFAREDQPRRSLADHAEILEAVLQGNSDEAQTLARAHAQKMQTWVEGFTAHTEN